MVDFSVEWIYFVKIRNGCGAIRVKFYCVCAFFLHFHFDGLCWICTISQFNLASTIFVLVNIPWNVSFYNNFAWFSLFAKIDDLHLSHSYKLKFHSAWMGKLNLQLHKFRLGWLNRVSSAYASEWMRESHEYETLTSSMTQFCAKSASWRQILLLTTLYNTIV